MFRKSIGLVRSFHDLNIPYSFTGIGRVFKRSTHFYFDTTTNIGSTSYVKSIKPSKKTRDLDTSTGTGTVEHTDAVMTDSNRLPVVGNSMNILPIKSGSEHTAEMGRDEVRMRMEYATNNDQLPVKPATFPWLVEKLSRTYPDIANATVPSVITIPSDPRGIGNVLRDILIAANNTMIRAQVPPSIRRTCITELADQITDNVGLSAVSAIFPESWQSSVTEYLQCACFLDVFPAMDMARDHVLSQIPVANKSPQPKIYAFTKTLLANVSVVWSILKSEERPVPEKSPCYPELLSTITLPKGHYWPFGIGVGHTLFIRSSQQHLPEEIMSEFDKFRSRYSSEKLPSLPRCGDGYIIKGSPDIGTTALLNLLMYEASKRDVDVVIHFPALFAFVLHRDGTVTAYEPKDIDKVNELSSPQTLYLHDPLQGDSNANVVPAFTVIATSPDRRRYKSHKKLWMRIRWLSPWKLNELYAAHRALQPDEPLSQQQRTEIRRRFEYFGGSLRLSLASEECVMLAKQCVDSGLARLTLETLQSYRALIYNEADCTYPHVLLHCYPRSEERPNVSDVGFASSKSRTAIYEALAAQTEVAREDVDGIMRQLDPSPATLGFIYEHDFHDYMSCFEDLEVGSSNEKLDVFDHAGNYDSTLSVVPKVCKTEIAESAVADALVRNECTYVIPTQSDCPLVDSFYVNGSTVYCFQVTKNSDQSFNSELWDKLREDIQSAYSASSHAINESGRPLTFKYCRVHDQSRSCPKLKDGFFSLAYENIFPSAG